MTDLKTSTALGCGCASFLADTLEAAGHQLIQRRNFFKLSIGTAGLLAATHAITLAGSASTQTSPVVEQPIATVTGNAADTIYFGGPIVTMVADGDYVEALAVQTGKIITAGTLDSMESLKGANTKIDVLIEAVKAARPVQPHPELRTTIIHAQTIREDQLDFAAAQGLVPSFFPIHITYWGDRHRELFLGPERADRISPAKSALNRNMKFTLHHDAPIAGIGMLPVAVAAVNRVTSSGQALGFDQRITAFEALRAITVDAAWQYFEEDRKGTLEVGKLADLVILSADPLAEDPMKMADIEVLETIKEGETVYKR